MELTRLRTFESEVIDGVSSAFAGARVDVGAEGTVVARFHEGEAERQTVKASRYHERFLQPLHVPW